MKGLYITTDGNSESAGVEKKINNQIQVLGHYFEMNRLKIIKNNQGPFQKIISRLPFGSNWREYDEAIDEIRRVKPDFVIFRGIEFDRRYVSFIGRIKQELEDVIILFEVPTYPYGRELLYNRTMWPWFFKDAYYRKRVSRIIDRVITYSDDDKIFGVPTIKVKNGLIVDSISICLDSKDRASVAEDSINLLAVAQLQKYHGYDRIFQSIADYYRNGGTRTIQFDIVGDGDEGECYLQMVKKLGISNRVTFHGKIIGEELKKYYEKADIGVGSFASFRIGVFRSSNLKIREYLANGLPIISGCYEDIFEDKNVDFYKNFPNDDSTIDFSEIISFYDKLYDNDRNELRSRIHEFARQYADMNVVMRPVIEYLENAMRRTTA